MRKELPLQAVTIVRAHQITITALQKYTNEIQLNLSASNLTRYEIL